MIKVGDEIQYKARDGVEYRATVLKVHKGINTGRVDLSIWGMGAGSGPKIVKDLILDPEVLAGALMDSAAKEVAEEAAPPSIPSPPVGVRVRKAKPDPVKALAEEILAEEIDDWSSEE